MASSTTVLITGCKSGIGKGLLAAYVSRDNTTAIAAIRDGPSTAAAKALEALPKGANSRILVVKYDASSESSVKDVISYLHSEHDVTSLDVVVANAGILKQWGPVRTVKSEDILEHFTINTLATIQLYQATAPLLDNSKQTPKFFTISSTLGSNGLMDDYAPMQMIAYNMSKAAVNSAAGRMHREEDRLVVVPIHPGWIATDMGSRAAVYAGMKASDPPVALEDSIAGLMNVFDRATKDEYSGKLWNQENEILPW